MKNIQNEIPIKIYIVALIQKYYEWDHFSILNSIMCRII